MALSKILEPSIHPQVKEKLYKTTATDFHKLTATLTKTSCEKRDIYAFPTINGQLNIVAQGDCDMTRRLQGGSKRNLQVLTWLQTNRNDSANEMTKHMDLFNTFDVRF